MSGAEEFAHTALDELEAVSVAVEARREALARRSPRPSARLEESADPVVDGRVELEQILAEAPEVLDRLEAGQPSRGPGDDVVLEAIVELVGRPALRIVGGRFARAPETWRDLEDHRTEIEQVIASVGRVQADPAPHVRWLATAFVVAPGVAMTNRHVAEAVAETLDDVEWTFTATLSVDFVAEQPEVAPGVSVTRVLGIHDEYDLALLGFHDGDSPPPLELAAEEPEGVEGGSVYTVGIPVQDGARNDPEHMQRIFDGKFRVKCLQPGKAVGLRNWEGLDVLGHDCSTLGGNSGSCLVELATARVAGLHFRGDWREVNHAVPLWLLTEDELLASHGTVFA